jgi:hypothetical protein
MARIYVYPYNQASKSARLLRDELNGWTILREHSRYRHRNGNVVINWGCSGNVPVQVSYNQPEAVAIATHKLRTFTAFARYNVPHPEVTQSIAIAQEWASRGKVVGRTYETGRQGRGCVVYPKGSVVGQHLFYTKYFRKQREFRIHVFRGRVIFESEKLRRAGADVDPYIRSHNRGWVLAFHHLENNPVPQEVRDVAMLACAAIGLDFGAADIGWNERQGAAVFEVNSAPGIEESTLDAYANAFREDIRARRN